MVLIFPKKSAESLCLLFAREMGRNTGNDEKAELYYLTPSSLLFQSVDTLTMPDSLVSTDLNDRFLHLRF